MVGIKSIFSDCLTLSFLPDISNWNNYKEKYIYETPDYERINRIENLNVEYTFFPSTIEDDKIFNDSILMENLRFEKYSRLYD